MQAEVAIRCRFDRSEESKEYVARESLPKFLAATGLTASLAPGMARRTALGMAGRTAFGKTGCMALGTMGNNGATPKGPCL